MSVKIENGGPAYPMAPDANNDQWAEGLTKRDYFAAEAMNGMIASYKGATPVAIGAKGFLKMAQAAYALADAMIEARK